MNRYATLGHYDNNRGFIKIMFSILSINMWVCQCQKYVEMDTTMGIHYGMYKECTDEYLMYLSLEVNMFMKKVTLIFFHTYKSTFIKGNIDYTK